MNEHHGGSATIVGPDRTLVMQLARLVGEALAADEIEREASGRSRLSTEDARQLAASLAAGELDRVASDRLARGVDLLHADDELALFGAVMASVVGLGRIQPYLDSPDVSDIHIRGCDSVWLKLHDGSRVPGEPVADSDDELIELVRLVATRMGRSERRFDAANPELNLQLPDGSRLFATMEVSARPSVVIRRHRFELSSLDELATRGMVDDELASFLSAAVRARRNIIVAGGTGTGKTTLLRALLNEVPSHERLVTIEDAYELGLDRFADRHPDHDMLQARPANIEGRGEVTMLDLARMALRMDPGPRDHRGGPGRRGAAVAPHRPGGECGRRDGNEMPHAGRRRRRLLGDVAGDEGPARARRAGRPAHASARRAGQLGGRPPGVRELRAGGHVRPVGRGPVPEGGRAPTRSRPTRAQPLRLRPAMAVRPRRPGVVGSRPGDG